jgi:hypothetical protein
MATTSSKWAAITLRRNFVDSTGLRQTRLFLPTLHRLIRSNCKAAREVTFLSAPRRELTCGRLRMRTPGVPSATKAYGHRLIRCGEQIFAIGPTLGNFSSSRAGSSAVERQSYTLLVGGSIPSLPIGWDFQKPCLWLAIDNVALRRRITI